MDTSVLVVSGFFKENSAATGAGAVKMMKVLEAESNAPQKQDDIA